MNLDLLLSTRWPLLPSLHVWPHSWLGRRPWGREHGRAKQPFHYAEFTYLITGWPGRLDRFVEPINNSPSSAQPWDSFTSNMMQPSLLCHNKRLRHRTALSNLSPPLFPRSLPALLRLRAKWLFWQPIAASSPTAMAATSWPRASRRERRRCWRWGVKLLCPKVAC